MVVVIWTFYTALIFLWCTTVVKVLAQSLNNPRERDLDAAWPADPGLG